MITPSIHGWGDWHQDAWSGGKANGRVGNFPSLEVIPDGIPNGRMDFLKEKIKPNHFLIHDIHRNSSGHPNFFSYIPVKFYDLLLDPDPKIPLPHTAALQHCSTNFTKTEVRGFSMPSKLLQSRISPRACASDWSDLSC